MEPKEKKRKKKHDPPREHDGEDVPSNETTHVAPEQPQEAFKAKTSSEGHKRSENSGDDSQTKIQPPTNGVSETSGNKKVKKRRKEKGEKPRLMQGDVSKETITPPEPVPPSVDDSTKDEKKGKKRKHKEKREEDVEANHGGTAATKLEPLASQTDDAKGEKKKRKSKDEKAAGEKRKHEDTVANDVERKRRKRKEE